MTDEVIIKEVEGQKIWLGEMMLDKHASKILIGFVISIIIITSAWVYWTSKYYPYGEDVVTPIVSLLGVLSVIGIIAIILIKNDSRPAYVIHTPGVNGIVIFKTTPEADQVAICRATQELEVKVKEISKKRREMETIAGMCR